MKNPLNTLKEFESPNANAKGKIYSLKALKNSGFDVSRLPVSIKIVLESVLRNCDGKLANESDVKKLAAWSALTPGDYEVPFVVSRVVLQDLTGVPLLVDLAAMRDAAQKKGGNPNSIEPLVPVDLVVDHSVQMDFVGTSEAYKENLDMEFSRNKERYEFMKWGKGAFKTFSVVPPSTGIIHQVNMEYLARMVFESKENGETIFYPDSLVGTDSHTTMINGLGVAGWGVGGIEAEAGMLGLPVYFKVPQVVGVCMTGSLNEGVTATDLALHVTKILRQRNVVGKFVEFFGEGAQKLSLSDRTTVANMAPEYGATMGYFPVDETTLDYLRLTGRDEKLINLTRDYYKEQGIFGIPLEGECDYSETLVLDLSEVKPCISGPKRPQDEIELSNAKTAFEKLASDSGKNLETRVQTSKGEIGNGSILIAAITSCTNTSNPSVLVAAGLLAKKAHALGLKPPPYVKTSFAPGSRAVSEYMNFAGLQEHLDALGFNLAGYGCATCIGNSGPLPEELGEAISKNDLLCASVLSGNRNFEARIHPLLKANYLMSPPLVVAYAIAGKMDIDFDREPMGKSPEGKDVFLSDIWPSSKEVADTVKNCVRSEMFKKVYSDMKGPEQWSEIKDTAGEVFPWNEDSTYIQKPPFFEAQNASEKKSLSNLRPLLILGDSVTTDHISPASSIPANSPAGIFLKERGVQQKDFNSYGSRRGNDRIMTRGTFANVRIKNKIAGGAEGGYTKIDGKGENVFVFDAAQTYAQRGDGLIVISGRDYGMGSSRDWAAKGTSLLGVKVVVAKSFERIHRSNLVGMGVLPFEFDGDTDAETLSLDGTETFSILGLEKGITPQMKAELEVKDESGNIKATAAITLRVDTPIEVEYLASGGILPYVLEKILKS